jgi:hypothetical protein
VTRLEELRDEAGSGTAGLARVVSAAVELAAATYALDHEVVDSEVLHALGRRDLALHELLVETGFVDVEEVGS